MTEQNQTPAQIADTAINTESKVLVNQQQNTIRESTSQTNEFNIPDAYKEKNWASKVKSQDDLWKMLDNSQSLIGKKSVVPDFATAKPEEIQTYFESLRPKDKTAYKFDDAIPDEQKAELVDLLYNSNISDKQAELLLKNYNSLQEKLMAKMVDKDDFINRLKTSFGNDYEKKTAPIIEGLRKTLGKSELEVLDKMPNEYLEVIYKLADKYNQVYGAKAETGAGANQAGSSNKTTDEVTADIAKVRADLDGLKIRPHTAQERQVLVDKLKELTFTQINNKK